MNKLLTHDLRRLVFRLQHPKKFAKWQAERRCASIDGYSLEPFDRTKSIFVHIPKAAGTSVTRTLYSGPAGGHTDLRRYQLIFSRRDYNQYFKFTFVRNPWDRLQSAYHFLRAGGVNQTDQIWANRHLQKFQDFEEFVMRGLGKPNIMTYTHFIPQHRFVERVAGGPPGVDYIGRFETLQDDFSYIFRVIHGADSTAPALPLTNATTPHCSQQFADMYTPEMQRKVAEVYASDISCFGYDFDNNLVREYTYAGAARKD